MNKVYSSKMARMFSHSLDLVRIGVNEPPFTSPEVRLLRVPFTPMHLCTRCLEQMSRDRIHVWYIYLHLVLWR